MMKNFILFSGVVLVLSLVTGCGSNKELQERAPPSSRKSMLANMKME